MAKIDNLEQAILETTIRNSILLNGILKVLTDRHCEDMSDAKRQEYLESLSRNMESYEQTLKDGLNSL